MNEPQLPIDQPETECPRCLSFRRIGYRNCETCQQELDDMAEMKSDEIQLNRHGIGD